MSPTASPRRRRAAGSAAPASRPPAEAASRRLQDHVYHVVVQRAGLGAGDVMLAAVSGGPDSMTLLHALRNVRERGGPTIHVAHFDHELRAESAAVAAEVVAVAGAWELPVVVGRPAEPLLARPIGISLVMAARAARWSFLRAAAGAAHAARIATGHTADDQVETVIMNLARGAGSKGLQGMATDDGVILRPLLDIPRAEVQRYAARHALVIDWDPSNADVQYRRNRIRHELLPLLNAIFPGASGAITRTARVLREIFEHRPSAIADGAGLRFPPHPQRQLVRAGEVHAGVVAAYRALGIGGRQLTQDHLGRITFAATMGRIHGRWIGLPGGAWAYVRDGAVALYPERPALPAILRTRLPSPGQVAVPGATLTTELIAPHAFPGRAESPNTAYLDADSAGHELWLRTPQPADTFQPLGALRARNVLDFLKSRRVPASLRPSTLLVLAGGRIAWVVGVEIGAAFVVGPATRAILRLTVEWA